MSNSLEDIKNILIDTLQLGGRGELLTASSALLGNLPEFDSMAVVNVIVAIEEYYGFTVDDDEISADTFETVGSLVMFVEQKLAS